MSDFSMTRVKENTTVLCEYKDVILKVDYFWDNHGDLIKWNDCVEEPKFWNRADVQIRKYAFTDDLCGKLYDFEIHQLVVDGRVIAGDVVDYTVDTTGIVTITCDMVVGWG